MKAVLSFGPEFGTALPQLGFFLFSQECVNIKYNKDRVINFAQSTLDNTQDIKYKIILRFQLHKILAYVLDFDAILCRHAKRLILSGKRI